ASSSCIAERDVLAAVRSDRQSLGVFVEVDTDTQGASGTGQLLRQIRGRAGADNVYALIPNGDFEACSGSRQVTFIDLELGFGARRNTQATQAGIVQLTGDGLGRLVRIDLDFLHH